MAETATEEALKSTLWLHIGRIVDETTLNLGINATPQFIASLMELTYAQIQNAGKDVEAFAAHAGRNTVKVDDVLMLGRRNEGLKSVLDGEVARIKKEKEGVNGKKKTAG